MSTHPAEVFKLLVFQVLEEVVQVPVLLLKQHPQTDRRQWAPVSAQKELSMSGACPGEINSELSPPTQA